MALLVRKYGGSSVASVALIERIATQIIERRREGHDIVVVLSAMGDSTDRLLDLARSVSEAPPPRELDALLCTGEQISVALMAMALERRGCAAHSFSGAQAGISTTDAYGRARILAVDTARLRAALAAGRVPIVAGFQGVCASGDNVTIGRGGSDTTAVALAVALQAEECQIFTDVDGVYTTDPRLVPGARRLDHVSFEEMLELAGQGSRVLQIRAVEFANRYGINLRVLSSFRTGPGTLISKKGPYVEAPVVSGIAYNRDEAQITVTGVRDRPGMAFHILEPVSAAPIEIDMLVMNAPRDGRVDFSFTVHRADHARAAELVRQAVVGWPGTEVLADDRVAKVSVVGAGMRSHAGVATRLFAALGEAGVNVRLVSTSEIKIAVLLDEQDMERAVHALHAAYALDQPGPAAAAG